MSDLGGAEVEAQVSADLVLRIGKGEREAEQQMVARYSRGLLFLLRRKANDPELALDLAQDTFRIALEKLRVSSIEEPGRLAAYLRGIALKLLVGQRRKDARRATSPDSEAIERVADHAVGPFDRVSAEQAQRAVRALLEELPVARDREILTRWYLKEEEKDYICERLGVDSLHFNRVLFRAKQRFRELVEDAERRGRLKLVGS